MERQASMQSAAIGASSLSASNFGATRRKLVDYLMLGVVLLCAAIGVAVLAIILIDVVRKGAAALNPAFFLSLIHI